MNEIDAIEAAPARRPPLLVFALIGGWALLVLAGFVVVESYASTPGARADAPERWPAGAVLSLDPEKPTLVMVLHPECACSRASVAELSRLSSRLGDRVRTHVVIVLPEGLPRDFAEGSDLWASASAIGGVHVTLDEAGHTARAFGAHTSGSTFLYDPSGELLFSGGITPRRGHQGDNVGRDRILSLVRTGHGGAGTSNVYGCRVDEESS